MVVSKLCCIYIQYLVAMYLPLSQRGLLRFISRHLANSVYFEDFWAKMVTIRHSFDPEEFPAHESF
jgi:hypothetical protein